MAIHYSFVGKPVQDHRGALTLHHPMEHSTITSWSDMETVWSYTYSSLGSSSSSSSSTASSSSANTLSSITTNPNGINPSNHPLLVTEAPLTSKKQREKMAQIFFESLHVPAVYITPSSPLALYASGRTTGLVLECGEGVTTATPIYEGYAVTHAISRGEYGGAEVTKQLSLLLRKAGVALHTTAEIETVRSIKETASYVAANPSLEETMVIEGRYRPPTSSQETYRLPDGTRLNLGPELFRAPEVLFRPNLVGLEYPGLSDLLSLSIAKSDLDLRTSLLSNILLAGGTTTTRGLGARLLTEVRKNTAPDVKVRIWAPNDRTHLTWVGGSILGSLSTFRSLWITKDTWEEEGPNAIHRVAL